MAAYAATVTLGHPTVRKLPNGVGMLFGSVLVSNYNQAKVEITGITSRFKGAPSVILGGVTTTGHLVAWDTASKSIKAFDPASTLGAEVANDVNIGTVSFAAVGIAP